MKIAILNTWKGGAVHNIMKPLADELNSYDGITCDYVTLRDDVENQDFDLSFFDYDIVHVGYYMNMQYIKDFIEIPYTCNVHHIPMHRVDQTFRFIAYHQPYKVITADPFCQRQLGQMGLNGAKIIPYAFDHEDFYVMPVPEEFSIGYLGCDSEAKRFSMIEEAAVEAGVKCVGIDRATKNEEEDFMDIENIQEIYRNCSVYVSAGWNDGGPLPPQEALLCGRPVVTTRVGMMPQVIQDGVNGKFFDGTVSDLVEKIVHVKENYEHYRRGAMSTTLPSVKNVAAMYMEVFTDILEENE